MVLESSNTIAPCCCIERATCTECAARSVIAFGAQVPEKTQTDGDVVLDSYI